MVEKTLTSNRQAPRMIEPDERKHRLSESIESAPDLAQGYERRIKFQANVQGCVEQSIGSTINVPAGGTEGNNDDRVRPFAETLAQYPETSRVYLLSERRQGEAAHPFPYRDAQSALGIKHDICKIGGKGGVCGS